MTRKNMHPECKAEQDAITEHYSDGVKIQRGTVNPTYFFGITQCYSRLSCILPWKPAIREFNFV
jgi:hypothetical protein